MSLQNKKSAAKTSSYLVADAFLEALAEAGIDYIFIVYGSDHPSIIEAYVRRQNENKEFPKMIVLQHEFVAMSAADAYARLTCKPSCVIVHVDVGTAALGQGLQNASSGRAPVLIFAGMAPSTFYGELRGSRTEHVQWYQDVPNQHALLAPYSRFTAEIKSGCNVKTLVHRALLMASTGSAGPVYLTGTREVLAEPYDESLESFSRLQSCHLGGLPEDAVVAISTALLAAEAPLIITGYLGRNSEAVTELVRLADAIQSLRVFDSEAREVSFPASHPAWITRSTGARNAIQTADVILVLDCDVPWIPTNLKPKTTAKIFHVDLDPRKEKMTLFDIRADATYLADCAQALKQICQLISSPKYEQRRREIFDHYKDERERAFQDGILRLDEITGTPTAESQIKVAQLFRKIRECVPKNTIFVSDAVTNQVTMVEQLRFVEPGTHISKGASGLGWAGGAAIGVKFATDLYDINTRPHLTRVTDKRAGRFVCSIIGDGSFIFSNPTAVYWASHRYDCPFLTIIIDNGGWNATQKCVRDVHPGGIADSATRAELGIALSEDKPDYSGVAKAAANGHLFARQVSTIGDLEAGLKEAVRVILEEKIGAVLDVIVD